MACDREKPTMVSSLLRHTPGSAQALCRLNIGDRGRRPLAREVCDSVTSNRLPGESGLLDTLPGPSR
jgi:hypothetical protein